MAAGISTGTRGGTFGSPLFGTITTGTTGTLGASRTGAAGGYGGASGSMNPGYSAGGQQPARYTTGMGFTYPRTAPSRLQIDLQQVLQRSSGLAASPGIRVALEGPIVVLRGKADNDHDRRLAEGLIRLTPGVRDVRNEIQVPAGPALQTGP